LGYEIGNFDVAEQLFEQALPILRDSVDASRQLYAELLYAMGRLKAKKGNYTDAHDLLNKSSEIAKGLGYLYLITLIENELAKTGE